MADVIFSTTYGDQILDWLVRNQSLSNIATPFISLHTAAPGLTGANEVTGGSYARQSALSAFGTAAASKSIASDANSEFTDMPAVTVTHIGVWTASTAGTFIAGYQLTASKVVPVGETFRLSTGNNTIDIL